MQEIFDFLKELKANNNREWFHQNKAKYLRVKQIFENYVTKLIEEIGVFDIEISNLSISDVVFRINNDTRFSQDKTPYKTYMSAAIKKGGKKSLWGGYYVHLQPEMSLFGGGIGGRDTNLIQAVRKEIYYNMEEFKSIVENQDFSSYYTLMDDKLKKMPSSFPSDFPDAQWLKYKRYNPANYVSDDFFTGDDVIQRSVERLKLLTPINRFLNYSLEEITFNANN